ncbi:hypothetical protein QYM36_017320 [Artemia franciscana]|uniref:Uncharacterized protein n=1 Tax=Artemia franciscana TaxID=6661 RepID=A0AA88HDW9_ARTSF|nr:hypothetical protein QYM36_017320 [Artemia franciscana]
MILSGLDDYGQPIDYSDTASSRIDYHQIRDSFEQSSSGSQAESTSSYHFLSQRDYEEYYGHRYRYDRYYEPQPRSHSLDHRLQRRLAMRTDLVEKADSVETVLTVVENSKPMEAKPKNRKERMMSQFKTFWNSKFNKLSAKMRKKTCNPAKIFIPAFMSIAMSLAAMVVIVFETENEFFASARRVPELVILRREYYEPAKDYIVEKWRSIFR